MSAPPLPADRVLVVAEIGNNHEGDPAAARALVHAAADAGCDAVKLQVMRADAFVRPSDTARLAQMRRFELSGAVVAELCGLGRALGLLVVATPLDDPSLALLDGRVDALKIASGDNDHLPLVRAAAERDVPLIVSAGLADLATVGAAVDAVRGVRGGDGPGLWLLQCTSAYPAAPEDANLAAMATLRTAFGTPVGYSDHTLGIEVAVAAVAAGARMVEKHLTLDHATSGFRDHALSADPAQMRALVQRVRWTERVLGDPARRPVPAEAPLLTAARRSVVAARDLPAGTVLAPGDLTCMRPRDGLPPAALPGLLGRRVAVPVTRGEAVTGEHLAREDG
jgi:sialic acid synthase SpsE